MKDFYKNNPDAIDKITIFWIGYWSNPKNRDTKSTNMIQHLKDHPEAIEEISKRTTEQYSTQKARNDQSDRLKNSKAMKIAIGIMIGGNDIIDHHYIYDHTNPKKYTMIVTRSKHTQIYNWMRKAGIIVPHINVTENNKDIFKVKYNIE